MAKEWLWVRLGDASGYEQFDDLEELAGYLRDCPMALPLERYGECGVVDQNTYQGNNCISLYWGDSEARAIDSLNDDELDELNDLLQLRDGRVVLRPGQVRGRVDAHDGRPALLTASLAMEGSTLVVRLDDDNHPELWIEIRITDDQLDLAQCQGD